MSGVVRWLLLVVFLSACARTAPLSPPAAGEKAVAADAAIRVRAALAAGGDRIDYDTLVWVYGTLRKAPGPVAHMDQLLFTLLAKRNPDPRVDQMIVIFTADLIGQSPYPIDNASRLFRTILELDDTRINSWVLGFVGDDLGRYLVDLPDGDALADLLEERSRRAIGSSDPDQENFGHHFLPPPKSEFVQAYIDGITDRRIREQERNVYYLMIYNRYDPAQIEAGLQYLAAHRSGEKVEKDRRLTYLFKNWEDVRSAMAAAK
jgi:hypothetical protein